MKEILTPRDAVQYLCGEEVTPEGANLDELFIAIAKKMQAMELRLNDLEKYAHEPVNFDQYIQRIERLEKAIRSLKDPSKYD